MQRVLKSRAAEDRAGAADRAMFDESKSLSLCLRYATAASRDLHRSISDLTKLREAGGSEDQDEEAEPPPSTPDPDGPGAGADSPSSGAAKLRNEATDAPSTSVSAGLYCGSATRDREVSWFANVQRGIWRCRGPGPGPLRTLSGIIEATGRRLVG